MTSAAPPRVGGVIDSSSDSEDDVPLTKRMDTTAAAAAATGVATDQNGTATKHKPSPAKAAKPAASADDSSDDDAPLATRVPPKPAAPASAAGPSKPRLSAAAAFFGDAEELPTAPKPKPKPKPAPAPAPKPAAPAKPALMDDSSDSEDDKPLAMRRPAAAAVPNGRPSSSNAAASKKERKPKAAAAAVNGGGGEKRRRRSEAEPSTKRRKSEGPAASSDQIRWNTFEHSGVLFPPEYEPHGVKMLYDGVPIDLTPEQEEVATMFAVMKETEYMKKETFLRNFWEGFQEVLGPNHKIKSLDKCDFTPMYEYHMAEREKKKAMTKEEKEAIKSEREDREAKYKYAIVDGRREQVGNFRVEPPGLFRGRGEHPKMGKVKRRIYPRDVTINIGQGVPVPTHPYPGQNWAEVRHDKTVTWLAFWKDPINTKEYKYVFLAANSTWKAESDLAKYEKARKLKKFIGGIRSAYQRDWASKDRRERQMSVALYFIDILALRAGHEKDEDEADTVGCCTLKCENVELMPPSSIKFDFLGKDSIRYENTVLVEPAVYKNIGDFKNKSRSGAPKAGSDQLFDEFDAQDLNTRLKDLMDGLSVKVFRTYNASITLDRLLADQSTEQTVEGRKAEYDRANKEVAILCNHQRSVPKGHEGALAKLQEKLQALKDELKELEGDLKRAKSGKAGKDGKKLNEDVVKGKIERKRAQIVKQEINMQNREDLKTVALGTSKINYLDPRITVAWCKRNEVPIEKVFNKSLLSKFLWSMDVEPDFRF